MFFVLFLFCICFVFYFNHIACSASFFLPFFYFFWRGGWVMSLFTNLSISQVYVIIYLFSSIYPTLSPVYLTIYPSSSHLSLELGAGVGGNRFRAPLSKFSPFHHCNTAASTHQFSSFSFQSGQLLHMLVLTEPAQVALFH